MPSAPVRHVIYLHGFASSPGSFEGAAVQARARGARSWLFLSGFQRARIRDADDHAHAPPDYGRDSRGACWSSRADRVESRCVRRGPRRGTNRERGSIARETASAEWIASSCSRRHSTSAAIECGSSANTGSTNGGAPDASGCFTTPTTNRATSASSCTPTPRDTTRFDVAFDQPALVFQGKRDDTVDSAMVSAGRAGARMSICTSWTTTTSSRRQWT